MSLAHVIAVDHDKCVNCHMCISVCPVKYCIDGSGETVSINHDLCIGCGRCVEACTHDARSPVDDMAQFMSALERGEKIVAVVAPAVATAFPDIHRFNGFLGHLGVKAMFDVSFGAELTVRSYLHHVDANAPSTVIAQPCPAIVTYIQTYRPELLPVLAPAHSPMLHTVQMIKEFFPGFASHQVAVISPCLAKKREFDETGLGDFNVTIEQIRGYIDANGIDLHDFEPLPFENPDPERATGFSSPGGLMNTVHRERPAIAGRTRRIEGEEIYHYLDALEKSIGDGTQPPLIDCLNCSKGCNGGPGTGNARRSVDELEARIDERIRRMREQFVADPDGAGADVKAQRRMRRSIDSFWRADLYGRSYVDRSEYDTVERPSDAEFRSIYARMRKVSERDHLNCASCGYNSCEAMAIAIHNGLNRPENCHHHQKALLSDQARSSSELYGKLTTEVRSCGGTIGQIRNFVENMGDLVSRQTAAVTESSASVEQLMRSIENVSGISASRRESVSELVARAQSGKKQLEGTAEQFRATQERINDIRALAAIISDIAGRTNLLSMNAAIEAARAGETGRGFGVVAAEIRSLANETGENASTVAESVAAVGTQVERTDEVFGSTSAAITEMIDGIDQAVSSMSEMMNQTDEMSSGSSQILQAVQELRDTSSEVSEAASSVSDALRELNDSMDRILAMSSQELEHSQEVF